MFRKPYKIFAVCFGLLLTAFTAYVMLDTFVIARPVTAVSQAAVPEAAGAETAEEPAEEAASGTENESEADTESDAAAEEESSESSRKHRKKPGEKGKGGKKRKEDSDSSSEAGRDTADNADTEAGDPADDSDTASNADSADDADSTDGADSADSAQTAGIGTVMTETSYSDDNMDIELSAYREYDTTIYVAEVSADSAYLKTAFANGTYGKNVTAKTSEIAGSTGAILAINGDLRNAGKRIRCP